MTSLKTYFFISSLLIGLTGNSQTFLTLTKETVGYSGFLADFKLDPNDQSVWLTTDKKLIHIKTNGEIESFIYLDLAGGVDVQYISAIEVTDTAIIGLDELEGLFYIPFDDFEHLQIIDPSLLSGHSIHKDAADTLWIGTKGYYDDGFFSFIDGDIINSYNTENCDLLVNRVYCILKDQNGRTWLTHWNEGEGTGITRVEDNVWTRMHIGNSNLPTQKIPNLSESPTGTIVAFTEAGICVYDEDTEDWVVYDMDNTNMPANYATNGVFDSEGRLWALYSETALAYTSNMTDWVIFDADNSPLTFTSNSDLIRIDANDNIWFQGYNRIHAVNLNTFGGWLGFEENESALQPVIYPNPTTAFFSIQATEEIEGVEIYDLAGTLVLSLKNQSKNINLSGLERGTYLVKVSYWNGLNSISKIVVN